MVGYLVYSMAGHDKYKVYAVIQEDEQSVWLTDGDNRTLDHLKKKNKKHVQLIRCIFGSIAKAYSLHAPGKPHMPAYYLKFIHILPLSPRFVVQVIYIQQNNVE